VFISYNNGRLQISNQCYPQKVRAGLRIPKKGGTAVFQGTQALRASTSLYFCQPSLSGIFFFSGKVADIFKLPEDIKLLCICLYFGIGDSVETAFLSALNFPTGWHS